MLTVTKITNGFDKEYSTQDRDEVAFLKDRGISYCYVKLVGENRVMTYKYKRNAKLFYAIANYYDYMNQKMMNADFVSMSTLINNAHKEVRCDD